MIKSFQSLKISRFDFSSSTIPRAFTVATWVPSSLMTLAGAIRRNAAQAPPPIRTMNTMYTAAGTPMVSVYILISHPHFSLGENWLLTYRITVDQQRYYPPNHRTNGLQIDRHSDVCPAILLLRIRHGDIPHRDEYQPRRNPDRHASKDGEPFLPRTIEVHETADIEDVPQDA